MKEKEKRKSSGKLELAMSAVRGVAAHAVTSQRLTMFLHHASQAWKSFLRSPLTSILTSFTISVTLLIFTIFILVVENIRSLALSARTEVTISLFLKEPEEEPQIAELKKEISALEYIDKVVYRTKNEALQDFKLTLGERGGILEGLESNNPLPASLEVTFREVDKVEQYYNPFVERYSQHPAIEHVEYSRSLIDRLNEFLKYFGWIGLCSMAFMLLVTSFIITNTIKLALYSHREEIEIMALVGATNSFIRAPYMIEGFFQGLLGGLVAVVISYFLYLFAAQFLAESQVLRLIVPSFSFISLQSIVLIIISGITVGALGSYLAVRAFIKRDFE